MSATSPPRDLSDLDSDPADLTDDELAQLEREFAENDHPGHRTPREAMENIQAGRPPGTHKAVAVVREPFEMGEKTVSRGSFLSGMIAGRSRYFENADGYEAATRAFAGDVPFVSVATESGVEPLPVVRGSLFGRSDKVVIVAHLTVVNNGEDEE